MFRLIMETGLKTGHSDASAVALYKSMCRIRRVEEALIREYHPRDEMRCPIHFCIGQEAAPAALGLTLERDDVISSHYRSHGYYLAKGAPLGAMVAEFYGKASGANSGLGGSMELAHHGSRIYSGAIVGGPTGLAIGSAFAQKFLNMPAVTVAAFGDGAMDEGIAYEAINLAALRGLPVLFLCENNGYAAHTALAQRARTPSPAVRAAAFGIDTEVLEDRDPERLLETMSEIVANVRNSQRPFFLEVDTYRHCGHVGPESDDQLAYRPQEELEARLALDPLKMLRVRIAAANRAGAIEEIESDIDIEIEAAIAAAREAPFPGRDVPMSSVSANSFDPVVTEFIDGPVSDFLGAQAEATLTPY